MVGGKVFAPTMKELRDPLKIFVPLAKKYPGWVFVSDYNLRDRLVETIASNQLFYSPVCGVEALSILGVPVIPRRDVPLNTFYMIPREDYKNGPC